MTALPPLRRRGALILASTLAIPGCRGAVAQGPARGASRLVMPLPSPCASRPGDIVGLTLEGPSDAAVMVFGQAFRAGDLPRGAALGCRRADGQTVPTQFDLKVRHPDGSARHGVVSIAVPALRGGERLGLVLTRGSPTAAAPLDLAGTLAGRRAVLEVTPLREGAPWRVDLLAAWMARREGAPWQTGPLAVQERLSLPVPAAAIGGAESMRLLADLALRADGSLWVDLWLRNDIAMRPGGGEAAYRAVLRLDGQEALLAELPRHFQYQGFGRLRGAVRGGGSAPRAPFLRHDVGYLADAAAIPRYDQSTGVDQGRLEELARARAEPAWEVPLAPRRIATAMGTGGARPDIGPVTGYQAFWLCGADRRASEFALDQAEAAGAIPWHHWDSSDPRRPDTWLNTRNWPGLWSDPRGGRPPRGMAQQVPGDTGWRPVRSHQPDLCYLPYLLTGRRAFLDGLLAQGCWSITQQQPGSRLARLPFAPIADVIVLDRNQNRTHAWSMRQVGNAAWIAPDGDPTGAFLRDAAATNWLWLRSRLPALTAEQGEVHGWVPGVPGDRPLRLPPWQQDYLASTVALAARRGNDDARACLAWMSNFLVGRFHAEAAGFPRHDGSAYLLAFSRTDAPGAPLLTRWAEVAEATRERDWSNGTGWRHSQGDYSRWALQSLAQIIDTLGDDRARAAYRWLLGAGAPFTAPDVYAGNAQLNIVPRDLPRVPARVLRCAA
jgi:hypothetical protein